MSTTVCRHTSLLNTTLSCSQYCRSVAAYLAFCPYPAALVCPRVWSGTPLLWSSPLAYLIFAIQYGSRSPLLLVTWSSPIWLPDLRLTAAHLTKIKYKLLFIFFFLFIQCFFFKCSFCQPVLLSISVFSCPFCYIIYYVVCYFVLCFVYVSFPLSMHLRSFFLSFANHHVWDIP